jgi:hypothetical protein
MSKAKTTDSEHRSTFTELRLGQKFIFEKTPRSGFWMKTQRDSYVSATDNGDGIERTVDDMHIMTIPEEDSRNMRSTYKVENYAKEREKMDIDNGKIGATVELRYFPQGACNKISPDKIQGKIVRGTPTQIVLHVAANKHHYRARDVKLNKENGREVGTDAYLGPYYKIASFIRS